MVTVVVCMCVCLVDVVDLAVVACVLYSTSFHLVGFMYSTLLSVNDVVVSDFGLYSSCVVVNALLL